MTTLIALLTAAFAGEIILHAEVPVEVAIDGQPIAQVYRRSRIHLDVPSGERRVNLLIGGNPTQLRLPIKDEEITHIVVGRTGVSTRREAVPDPQDEGVAQVEVRAVGREHLRLTIGDQTYRLAVGDQETLELPLGRHRAQLRSGNGQAIFATGVIELREAGTVVVQLSEGRAPEIVGSGGVWRPAER
ncbi:MAG: hypothetical protein EA397_08430 [Deltaproteobacteria bacterium]|nr:MAG: hypothetical protein EA397_08430 [Deltaproteobacteria bacterium]